MLPSPETWQLRIGARTILSVVLGLLPCYFVLFILPVYPLYAGHIQVPRILLSDIMAVGPTYQSFYILGFGIPQLVVSAFIVQAGELFKARGVEGGVANSLPFCICTAGFGLIILLAFCYNSDDPAELALHSNMHNVGTIIYFAFAAVGAGLYRRYLQPEGERKGIVHPADACWLQWIGSQMVVGTTVAGIVRVLHLFVWPLTCAIPMLIVECYVIGLAISTGVLGHLRLFMHLDAIDPIIDLSFLFQEKSA